MSKLSRIGWSGLALFFLLSFIVSAIGFLIVARSSSPADQAPACSFSANAPGITLPAPRVQKISKVSKLEITDIAKGSGVAATAGSCVTVKYYGWLANSGKVFDQDFDQPFALKFQLGLGYVIPGWDQGLIGMKVGGERRLVIPASLAYGSQANAQIPANSNLVFVVKLLSVN